MSAKKAEEMEERLLDFAVRVGAVVDALPNQRMAALLDECEQLCKIIASSLITAKKNRPAR